MAEVAFEHVAPVLTVHDLGAALERYARLGFVTELYESEPYGFVQRGGVELHLAPEDPEDPEDPEEPGTCGGVVYLYVSDADAVHAEWASAGVEGRFLGPYDTPYRLREFVYIDPDGIVHRVGSPL